MPTTPVREIDERAQVERLLAAARDTLAVVRYCWVVTAAEDGGANARVVLGFPNAPGEDPWTRWFLTRRLGRKAAEIRRSGRVTLAYQHDSGNAYVTLVGRGDLVDEPAAVASRLRLVDDPDGALAGRLLAVRVTVDRLELHARGITAEPWGHGRTLLERGPDREWRRRGDRPC